MEIIDKVVSLFRDGMFTNLIFLVIAGILGLVVALLIRLLIFKFIISKIDNWINRKFPTIKQYSEKSMRALVVIIQIVIILFFFSMAAELLELEILNTLLINILSVTPPAILVVAILFFGLSLGKIVSSKVSQVSSEYSSIVSFVIEFIIIYATILTALEYFDITATPFFEIFRVIIYAAGLIVAISLGIPIGNSIKKRMEEKEKVERKKKKR